MRQASIAAAMLAGAVALSPAPARAYDGMTLVAVGTAIVILSGPTVSALYPYSSPANYGPRYGYPTYGSYAASFAAPPLPQPVRASPVASGYALAANGPVLDGEGCHWTKRGARAVRICY